MKHYTLDLYEVKREITNYSKKVTKNLKKNDKKFIDDMIYGIASSKKTRLSDIARELKEDIKINHTIDRLSINLSTISKETVQEALQNHHKEVIKYIPKDPIVLLDDTDIAKPYGYAFEDLAYVRDGSALEETRVKGYNVCEAVVLSAENSHPISIYSKIYSTISDGFRSMNTETLDSIRYSKEMLATKATYVMDRGYDNNTIIGYFLKENNNEDDFIVRIKDNRKVIVKGRTKNVKELALDRKGKIRMDLKFSGESELKTTYISHTRIELPAFKNQELTLVIVYGLSEAKPMLLLTNRKLKGASEVRKIVRTYMSRWRIEEYFRYKKSEYGFEDMRVRSLHAMNVLNSMMNIHLGHQVILIEQMDYKLLTHKILERSKAIQKKKNPVLFLYQIGRGIKEILSHAKVGIKGLQNIEVRKEYVQLSLLL